MDDMTQVHELMVGMLKAHVPMSQRRDVQVGRHLLDAHAAVYAAGRAVGAFVGGGAVCRLPFLRWTEGEQTLDAVQPSPLIWGPPAGGGDDIRGGGGVRGEGR